MKIGLTNLRTAMRLQKNIPGLIQGQNKEENELSQLFIPGTLILQCADDAVSFVTTNLEAANNGKDTYFKPNSTFDWFKQPGARNVEISGIKIKPINTYLSVAEEQENRSNIFDKYRDGLTYLEFANELDQIKQQTNISDARIAQLIRSHLRNEADKSLLPDQELIQLTAAMTAALFGNETWRHKRSLLFNLMYLDLVENEIGYGRALEKKYGWERGLIYSQDYKETRRSKPYFGKMPMAGNKSMDVAGQDIWPSEKREEAKAGGKRKTDQKNKNIAYVQEKEISIACSWVAAFNGLFYAISDNLSQVNIHDHSVSIQSCILEVPSPPLLSIHLCLIKQQFITRLLSLQAFKPHNSSPWRLSPGDFGSSDGEPSSSS